MFVYIVKCGDGTLYTGVAKDAEKRVDAHNRLKSGAKYTKSRRPVTLVYCKTCQSLSDALRLERAIKRMPRSKKLALISDKGA